MEEWPLEVLNSLTLEEENGKTTVTLRGMPINATAEQFKAFRDNKKNMQGGFEGTWKKLDELLAKNHGR